MIFTRVYFCKYMLFNEPTGTAGNETHRDDPKHGHFTAKNATCGNINNDDYVLVCCITKKSRKHFVGEILDRCAKEDTIENNELVR